MDGGRIRLQPRTNTDVSAGCTRNIQGNISQKGSLPHEERGGLSGGNRVITPWHGKFYKSIIFFIK